MRRLRENLGFTQKDFARALNVRPRTYWRYEAEEGDPQTSFLEMIIAKFCVSPLWLLTGEGEMFQNTEQTAASDDNEARLLDGILGGGFSEVADAIGTLESNVPADILKDFYKVMDAFPPKLREELLLAAKQYYERNTVESLAREVEELKKELAALKAERAE